MKALFVHNSIFQFADNLAYSNNIPEQIWGRYLEHFDSLKVIGRGEDAHEADINISGRHSDRISFTRFPDVSFRDELFKRSHFTNLAQEYISEADAVIVRLPSVIGTIFLEVARRMNKPAAAEVVGSAWHEYWHKGGVWPRIQAVPRFLQTRRSVKRLSYAIYVTEAFLQQLYPCNGITSNASNVYIRDINRSRRLIQRDSLTITTVGTLNLHYKGYDVVLKALSALKSNGWDRFVFHCAGEGQPDDIKKLVHKYNLHDNVRILGSVTRDELMDLLDNTDLYIQPSRTEGLPRALIEAISRGCPCLASTVGGIPELLPEAFLHKPGDHKKLSRDILNYASDITERERMSKDNIKRAEDYLLSELDRTRSIFWGHFVTYAKTHQATNSLV